jgi:hypothetical protein
MRGVAQVSDGNFIKCPFKRFDALTTPSWARSMAICDRPLANVVAKIAIRVLSRFILVASPIAAAHSALLGNLGDKAADPFLSFWDRRKS